MRDGEVDEADAQVKRGDEVNMAVLLTAKTRYETHPSKCRIRVGDLNQRRDKRSSQLILCYWRMKKNQGSLMVRGGSERFGLRALQVKSADFVESCIQSCMFVGRRIRELGRLEG